MIMRAFPKKAGVAQLVEQRIRNAWVGSSNLFTGTNLIKVHSGHMVNTLFRRHGLHLLRGEGIGAGFDAALILIEVA